MVEALGAGDVPKAIELFEPQYAEKLSLAGTPEEVVEKIKTDIQPAGVNHMILALADGRHGPLRARLDDQAGGGTLLAMLHERGALDLDAPVVTLAARAASRGAADARCCSPTAPGCASTRRTAESRAG